MIKFLYSLFFLNSFLVFSQKDYITFHNKIIDAENAIMNCNYSEATKKYYDAFQNMDFVFLANCIAACKSAIKCDNDSLSFYFAKRAFEHGLKIDQINSDSILNRLKNKNHWKVIDENYMFWRNDYLSRIDTNLRHKVNNYYALDQFWRDKTETHPLNFLWRNCIRKKWYSELKNIVQDSLMPLIYEYGYLGEKIIGVDEKKDNFKLSKDKNNSFMVRLILIHYYSSKRPLSDTVFFQEIIKGNLHPKQFAEFADFKAVYSDEKKSDFRKLYGQWMWNQSKASDEELNGINERRKAIGIGTFDQRMKELYYFFKTNNQKNTFSKLIILEH